MLVFVVPFRSVQTCKDWSLICRLMEGSLRSMCNQKGDFQVVVVCHEKPDIEFSHANLTYIQVDLPIPGESVLERRRDRMRKHLIGLLYGRQRGARYLMKVDADDRISSRLVEFIQKQPDANGWVLHQGYVYSWTLPWLYIHPKHFERTCGSSTILHSSLIDLPADFDPTAPDLDFDNLRYLTRHSAIADLFAERGKPFSRISFPGAVYVVGNGENVSGKDKVQGSGWINQLKQRLRRRSLNQSIASEFCLTRAETVMPLDMK